MSVLSSLYIGSSGLTATSDAIGIVGDNIANASTIGFKGSRARFEDVLGGTAANGQRLGSGVRLAGAETLFGQGALLGTGRSLDLAVRGEGFFVVNGSHDGVEGTYYTRDGQFHLDDTGFLVNGEGLRLQCYPIDAQGNVSNTPGDLSIGSQIPPSATTQATIFANLDVSAVTPTAPFDPADPDNTSNFSTAVTVFDSLGASHRVDVYFRNNGAGGWEWHALADGGELTGGTAGVATEIASGSLTFNANGELDTEVTTASSANFLNAAPGQAIQFDFGDSITTDGGTGVAGTTQFSSPSIVNSLDQDGFGAGSLVDVEISEDGTITGRFNNGQSRPIAQVALADFANESGLLRSGGQLFRETEASGAALVDLAATGARGAISSGTLEASNVNLSDELVTLIAYQRAFQSNAKVVNTADEMLAEIANLKR
jgi:flagellar hook protein FlgE